MKMNMAKKKMLSLIFILGLQYVMNGQILDPVSWKTSVEKISESEYELTIKANIDNGWHLYSQQVPEGGPVATTFSYIENTTYSLEGTTEQSKGKTVNDPIFNMRITFFEKSATFKQRVRVSDGFQSIEGIVEYMVCDDRRCLPPTEKELHFSFGEEAVPETKTSEGATIDNAHVNHTLYGMDSGDIKEYSGASTENTHTASAEVSGNKSLWGIFGLGFLGGLLALLTPCVFPMIPLTVSFFTKSGAKSNSKSGIFKALLYGFFILAVYLLLSIPFHLLDSVNPDILNEISTNVWLNLAFFIIFLFFAFSFFGYYELTLPSSWTSKSTQSEGIGGVLGIFFMALTLALVSFSCTGPILGSLLAGSLSASGGAWQLTAGMGGFGVALGLPFALFAMFPNMMKALPKSGGWLNTTKVILGFLELALAFKFLSNADLVQHWGILKIEPFLIIWIIIFIGLALYLFGWVKFPHDSPLKKKSVFRIGGGILAGAFALYLATGFRVNQETKMFTPLKLLSGLAPPVGYSFLRPNNCPNDLDCYKDLKTGWEHAKKVNKPILLDFTGYACVNCRKMEEHVWSDPAIDAFIRDNYVLVSLYVDDKKELEDSERIQVGLANGGTRTLKNYGHKWAHFQTQFFKTNSQPYYVLVDPETMELLNQPVGYTPDIDAYGNWLEKGIQNAKNQ
jgi:thiol:disulfide interchange protein